ncbi:helix-turn-helix transcriptional regulator [Halalkalibacter flavus]|uniref:helix-turn-helix transcriptional regulator n=1 Tax=Halalkalibacter flavus TaxID=3090668 RepID=UPI002FC60147
MSVKNNLKDIRHDYRMNQTEFADLLGLNVNQYNKYEHNRKQPNLETALMISGKLNKTVNELFERVPDN